MTELNTLEEAKAVLKGIEEGKVIEAIGYNKWHISKVTINNLPNFLNCKYRVKPEVNMIPLDRWDFKIFKTIVRPMDERINHYQYGIIGVSDIYVSICTGNITYADLMRLYEYSNDNGVTWKRCEKEGV